MNRSNSAGRNVYNTALLILQLSLVWLLLIGWAAICVFYLSFSPLGYVSDLERFILPGVSGG